MTPPSEQSLPPISSEEISTPGPIEIPTQVETVKIARVLEEEDGVFSLEYDNTRGEKNVMTLDAITYPKALREARSFLGIGENDRDEDRKLWDIE